MRKSDKGISLISLTVAVAILIIISSMLIFNAKNGLEIRKLNMLKSDIEILNTKVAEYYLKNDYKDEEKKEIDRLPVGEKIDLSYYSLDDRVKRTVT